MHANVQKTLEETRVQYILHKHADLPMEIRSPKDFANALGYQLERITKTLFVKSVDHNKFGAVVCSTNKKINFQKIAALMGCKKIEVANAKDLFDKTGYPQWGVSPVGLGSIPVFIDNGIFVFDTILIGAGEAGVEIEINPIHLKDITKAVTENLVE